MSIFGKIKDAIFGKKAEVAERAREVEPIAEEEEAVARRGVPKRVEGRPWRRQRPCCRRWIW